MPSEKPLSFEDSLALHLSELESLDPLSKSQIEFLGSSSSINNSFRRESTEQTRALDSSGIFIKPKRNEGSNNTSAPLGVTTYSKPPERERIFSESNPVEDMERGASYLRSDDMRSARDKANGVLAVSTDKFIEDNVQGGINNLIQIIKLIDSTQKPFTVIEIKKMVEKYKLSSISATTLQKLGMEISSDEAKSFGLSEYEISLLSKQGVVNDDRKKMRSEPLIFRGDIGEKYVIKHFRNLISVQKPNIVDSQLLNWASYYFRIQGNFARIVRADFVRNLGSVLKLSANIIIPTSEARRFENLFSDK